MGGEFMGEFGSELESFGTKVVTVSAFSPTQNAHVERHGGQWKHIAKAVCIEQGIDFRSPSQVAWLCMAVSWSKNNHIDESGILTFTVGSWSRYSIALLYDVVFDSVELARQALAGQELHVPRCPDG